MSGPETPVPATVPATIPVTVRGARPEGISRREAVQWVLAAVAAAALPGAARGEVGGQPPVKQEGAATQPAPTGRGYGTDPALPKLYKPGDVWPLTFTAGQRTTATALADVILPTDALGPAASEVGVVDMVDEWVSAPYPQQQADRPVVLEGLAWLEAESGRRFGKGFAALPAGRQRAICDDVCFLAAAKPPLKQAAEFFSRFRSLCAAAYYGTPPGWKAIGYVGNVALPAFEGPPLQVLEKLGVTQTVS